MKLRQLLQIHSQFGAPPPYYISTCPSASISQPAFSCRNLGMDLESSMPFNLCSPKFRVLHPLEKINSTHQVIQIPGIPCRFPKDVCVGTSRQNEELSGPNPSGMPIKVAFIEVVAKTTRQSQFYSPSSLRRTHIPTQAYRSCGAHQAQQLEGCSHIQHGSSRSQVVEEFYAPLERQSPLVGRGPNSKQGNHHRCIQFRGGSGVSSFSHLLGAHAPTTDLAHQREGALCLLSGSQAMGPSFCQEAPKICPKNRCPIGQHNSHGLDQQGNSQKQGCHANAPGTLLEICNSRFQTNLLPHPGSPQCSSRCSFKAETAQDSKALQSSQSSTSSPPELIWIQRLSFI